MIRKYMLFALCSMCMLAASMWTWADESAELDNVFGTVFYDSADLSKLKIPKSLPDGYPGLSHSLYREGLVIEKSKDVEDTCLKREQFYAYEWTLLALDHLLLDVMPVKPSQMPGFNSIPREKMLPCRKANGKDDVLFVHYQTRNIPVRYDVQIVDWRDVSFFVTCEGLGKRDMQRIVDDVICDSTLCRSGGSRFRIAAQQDLGEGRSCGKVEIYSSQTGKVISNNIEWYREADSVLLVLPKEHRKPSYLGPDQPHPERWYGGMPYDDPRPLLRFETSNRRQVAEEYAKSREEADKNKK